MIHRYYLVVAILVECFLLLQFLPLLAYQHHHQIHQVFHFSLGLKILGYLHLLHHR
tara:strand:- start:126 stop:293 length:168 start_codon:yes stop_codon:yes gene_type:complete